MRLSVIVPTLDCVDVIGAHLRGMERWKELAGEIIFIDSFSEDGTKEAIEREFEHPNFRVLSHPRGLYQSWNHGISESQGDWVYISTVGDTMEREQLEHLMDTGENLNADVVCSPPMFLGSDVRAFPEDPWPVTQLLEELGMEEAGIVNSDYLFIRSVLQLYHSYLGSSASDVYRGAHIRERLFPVEYWRCGDTAWPLINGFETRFAFTPQIGSHFLFHSKEGQDFTHERTEKLKVDFRDLVVRMVDLRDPEGKEPVFQECKNLVTYVEPPPPPEPEPWIHPLPAAKAEFSERRKAMLLPWYLSPGGWKFRKERKETLEELAKAKPPVPPTPPPPPPTPEEIREKIEAILLKMKDNARDN